MCLNMKCTETCAKVHITSTMKYLNCTACATLDEVRDNFVREEEIKVGLLSYGANVTLPIVFTFQLTFDFSVLNAGSKLSNLVVSIHPFCFCCPGTALPTLLVTLIRIYTEIKHVGV